MSSYVANISFIVTLYLILEYKNNFLNSTKIITWNRCWTFFFYPFITWDQKKFCLICCQCKIYVWISIYVKNHMYTYSLFIQSQTIKYKVYEILFSRIIAVEGFRTENVIPKLRLSYFLYWKRLRTTFRINFNLKWYRM